MDLPTTDSPQFVLNSTDTTLTLHIHHELRLVSKSNQKNSAGNYPVNNISIEPTKKMQKQITQVQKVKLLMVNRFKHSY